LKALRQGCRLLIYIALPLRERCGKVADFLFI
jgi:hypothetical protein